MILLPQLSWWVPAVLATGDVLMTVRTRLREGADGTGRTAAGLRRAQYLRDQAFEPASGREARLFGLSAWFRQQSDREWHAAMTDVWRARSNTRRTAIATIVALIGSYVFVFGYIMLAAFDGRVGVTEAALYLQGAGGLVNLWLARHVVSLREATRPFPALQALIDEEARPAAVPGTTDERAPATLDPRAPIVAIDVGDVTYRYPGQHEPVFDGLNLRIDARCALAIVGANGAGKTTLVKLLCGLLEPLGGAS